MKVVYITNAVFRHQRRHSYFHSNSKWTLLAALIKVKMGGTGGFQLTSSTTSDNIKTSVNSHITERMIINNRRRREIRNRFPLSGLAAYLSYVAEILTGWNLKLIRWICLPPEESSSNKEADSQFVIIILVVHASLIFDAPCPWISISQPCALSTIKFYRFDLHFSRLFR